MSQDVNNLGPEALPVLFTYFHFTSTISLKYARLTF